MAKKFDMNPMLQSKEMQTKATAKPIRTKNPTSIKTFRIPDELWAKAEKYIALENFRRGSIHGMLKKANTITEEDLVDDSIRVTFNTLIFMALAEYLERHMEGNKTK